MPRLLILDADGTLRWTVPAGQRCPHRPGQWRLFPDVRPALARLDCGPGGCHVCVASNQNDVALGYLSEASAHQMLVDTLIAALGVYPEDGAIEMCTCHPDAACDCRKPAPGMLLRLLDRFGVAPEQALHVGDLETDAEAARRAGIPFRTAAEFFGRRA